jgi:hypothetical protein
VVDRENVLTGRRARSPSVCLSGTPQCAWCLVSIWVLFSFLPLQGPTVALAFKLEEGRFGQLTYVRVYSGVLRKGDFIHNINSGKRIKARSLQWFRVWGLGFIHNINSGKRIKARSLQWCLSGCLGIDHQQGEVRLHRRMDCAGLLVHFPSGPAAVGAALMF